jgi:hypothetical protein
MPRRKILQTNFSAGELSPDLGMRQDTDQYQNGAKSLLNRRVLISGGTVRRPGSWIEQTLSGPGIGTDWIVNQSNQYVIVFNATRMDAYLRDPDTGDLSASGSVTSAPWTQDIIEEMDWVQSGNVMLLVHPEMPIQRIERTSSNTWVRTAMTFSTGPASRPEHPYFKVAPPAMTLAPGGLTGSVTLTTSASWFGSTHIGQYIRYMGKAALITGVTDSTTATATVVEMFPGTYTLTVTSSASFAVGEVVEGATSGAKGVVTGIPGGPTITAVISQGLTPFTTENLVGPNATTAISGVATTTPAAVVDWDEQLIGSLYGYPSCVALHRGRLCFGGHPRAPDYLITSTIGDLYNFNVGDGSDADAIMESIGDAGASRIVRLYSAEQLLVLTDRGPYYVPESLTTPFRPSSIAFLPFGSGWPITASARAQPFDGGVVFVSGSLVIVARPTGDNSRLWQADEVSLLSPHLIETPDRMAVVNNFEGQPERYCVIRNSDGTLAIMQLVEAQRIRNFTPWNTDGTYLSVIGVFGSLYAIVQRVIDASTVYTLERFDQAVTVDAATEYASSAALADGSTGAVAVYGEDEAHITTDDYYLGTYPLSTSTIPAGPFVAGLFYDSRIETLPPVIDDAEGAMAGDVMRIVECYVHVKSSARFAANGRTLSAYSVTDDVSEPPEPKNGPQRFQFAGWQREPTIIITQPDPLALEVLAVKSTVAF